jgi:hypothetical protein
VNLDELRDKRDLWPIVAERIPDAIEHAQYAINDILIRADIMEHLERKFRKGEAEHDRDWVDREDPNTLILDAAEEILDFVVYQAMFVVLLEAKANSHE